MRLSKTKAVIQDETAECGLACISYITKVHGNGVALTKLRLMYDVNNDGLSFHHLMKISSDLKLIATGMQLDATSLGELAKPAILLWNNCHFVVLTNVTNYGIEVMDPAVGIRNFTHHEVQGFFSGFALEITPASDFKKETELHKCHADNSEKHFYSMSSFRENLIRYRSYLLPILLCSVIVQLSNIGIPKFLSLVLDEVLPKNDEDYLYLLIYIFGFLYLIQSISGYIKIVVSQRLRRTVSQAEGLNSIQKLFRMDVKFFNKRLPSDILRKIKSVDVFHVIFTQGWIDIVVNVFFASVFVVLLFLISFDLALITVSITATMALIRLIFIPRIMSHQYSVLDSEIRRDDQLLESIKNIIAVKINCSEHRKIDSWFHHHAELENSRSSIEKMSAIIQLSLMTMSHLQTLLIVGVGSLSVLHGKTTVGQLVSFIFYKDYLISNIQAAVEYHVNLRICSVEVKRMSDLKPKQNTDKLDYKSSVLATFEKINYVELKDVSFGYSNLDKRILKNLNLRISSGSKIALVGPSGCGKTTIMNIFSGLLSPSEGEVLINGIELNRFGVKQFQKQISIVSPSDQLVNGSVIDNVIFESDKYDLQLLDNCLESADLKKTIQSLSAGVNTRLGINGARLSSGQQQRIMLARALYRQPELILMDEPTSHLDRDSANQIIELIKGIKVMCVIVTHDEDLVRAIDQKVEIGISNNG